MKPSLPERFLRLPYADFPDLDAFELLLLGWFHTQVAAGHHDISVGVEQLAADTRQSVRCVKRKLARLLNLGLLVRTHRGRPGTTSRYRVSLLGHGRGKEYGPHRPLYRGLTGPEVVTHRPLSKIERSKAGALKKSLPPEMRPPTAEAVAQWKARQAANERVITVAASTAARVACVIPVFGTED